MRTASLRYLSLPAWCYLEQCCFRPSNILLGAVFGTESLATLIAVYGVFIAPIALWKAVYRISPVACGGGADRFGSPTWSQ